MLTVIAGKGGVGKTTLAAVLARLLQAHGCDFAVVDADPVGRLGALLGAGESAPTVARLVESGCVAASLDGALEPLPGAGFLLRVGHTRRPGCFCRLNALAHTFIGALAARFPVVLVDHEAGLEHVARGIARSAGRLVVVADQSEASLHVARQIVDLARTLWPCRGAFEGGVHLVVRMRAGAPSQLVTDRAGDLAPHWLPHSEQVANSHLLGRPLPAFSGEWPYYESVRALAQGWGMAPQAGAGVIGLEGDRYGSSF